MVLPGTDPESYISERRNLRCGSTLLQIGTGKDSTTASKRCLDMDNIVSPRTVLSVLSSPVLSVGAR